MSLHVWYRKFLQKLRTANLCGITLNWGWKWQTVSSSRFSLHPFCTVLMVFLCTGHYVVINRTVWQLCIESAKVVTTLLLMNIVFSNSLLPKLENSPRWLGSKQIQISNPQYKSSTCNIFVTARKAIVHEPVASQKQLDLQRRESGRNKFSGGKKSTDPVPITEVHQSWWCLDPNIPNLLKINGIIFIQGDQGIKLVLSTLLLWLGHVGMHLGGEFKMCQTR